MVFVVRHVSVGGPGGVPAAEDAEDALDGDGFARLLMLRAAGARRRRRGGGVGAGRDGGENGKNWEGKEWVRTTGVPREGV